MRANLIFGFITLINALASIRFQLNRHLLINVLDNCMPLRTNTAAFGNLQDFSALFRIVISAEKLIKTPKASNDLWEQFRKLLINKLNVLIIQATESDALVRESRN